MERISAGHLHASYRLGDLVVTSLRDGFVDMPVSRLRQPANKVFGDELPAQVQIVDDQLRLSVNAFAVDDGDEVMLIDTGASNAWHASMGSLPEALVEANIAPARVTTVAFTHTHIDHINGLILANGDDAFPRLTRLLVPRAELEMFQSESRLARFHDRAEPFDYGQHLKAGVEVIGAPGHEVGHSCFQISCKEETLLVWGDIIHVPSLQFAQPEVTWEFDADQDRARESRLQILSLAADSRLYVAGAHLDSPGVGRVKRAGKGFAFEPL